MTYNIKTGGVDAGGGDRLDAVAAVVGREAPDVLTLQELRGFDRPGTGRLRGFADAVDMAPYLARSFFGQPVAVFVRPPGRVLRFRSLRWRRHHAAALAVVDTDRGPVTVAATHLNPYSGTRRLREARSLAARLTAAGTPALLMGDLNTLDPLDDHTDRLARLPAAYRRRHLRRAGSESTVDTRAVAALTGAGFVDLWRAVGGTGRATTAPTAQGGGAEFSGMRLDYILATASVAALARGCRIVDGAQSEYASDHYPVVADLDLTLR